MEVLLWEVYLKMRSSIKRKEVQHTTHQQGKAHQTGKTKTTAKRFSSTVIVLISAFSEHGVYFPEVITRNIIRNMKLPNGKQKTQ